MEVVAKENQLAPLLSPKAWQLISDAEAYAQGFRPTKVTTSLLKPRKKPSKEYPAQVPNSRLKVKFADELQIRLDNNKRPYSRTSRSVTVISDLIDSLGITLTPTINTSDEKLDALVRKAELRSRKQQPDLGGIYFVDGDQTTVNAAAEMLYTLDEVEWVIHTPVFSKMPRYQPTADLTPLNTHRDHKEIKETQRDVITIGACLVNKGDCFENMKQGDCLDKGGTFLGVNSICYIQPSEDMSEEERALGPIGECCTIPPAAPAYCTIVANEAGCNAINGIYLGIDTQVPPDPCGAAQTDCPAATGPPFSAFNDCADDGDVISYFTGDCYIDQTTVAQTSRQATPIGCADTDGTLGGPTGNDFIVITGMPVGFPTNVYIGSTCCEDIGTDVPGCSTGPWNNVCAAYAQSYAANERSCGRTFSDPTPINICYTALGPDNFPRITQPQVDMDNVTNSFEGIVLSNDGDGGANATASFVIDDPSSNGCSDGDCTITISVNGAPIAPPITLGAGTDLNNLAGQINTLGQGWAAAINGTGTVASIELNPISSTLTYNNTYTVPSVPQSLTAVPITGCLSPSGVPTYPRSNTTPDYASMGLLAWMNPSVIPNAAQPLSLPSSMVDLNTSQFAHIYQLLPWPMGGASAQNATLNPPLNPIPQNGWWGGDGGIDLFPDAPNPDGFGGQEVYLGSYGYGQFWEDDGVGTNGSFGNGVKVAVLDWSAHLTQRSIVDEFGSTVNLGGVHEEFIDLNTGLLKINLEGTATGHDPLTLMYDENLPFGYSADHGTAVLGVLGANWGPASAPGVAPSTRLVGNVGVLGMVPDAEISFFPLATVDVPDRQDQAWMNALDTLDAGDVICAAYRPVAISAGQPNINFWEDRDVYMEFADNLGITTVIRGGDQGIDLANLSFPVEDRNVIVATAVSPGSPFKRYCDGTRGSNYSNGTVQDYAFATASGWGTGVITCGKGQLRDNYVGYNTISYAGATPYSSPASDPHIVHAQAYTNQFGYTGSAAAQVAGGVAQLQGFSRQVFNMPIGSQITRQLIASGKFEGRNRDGTPILTLAPDVTTETGVSSSCEVVENTLDWDFCVDASANLTGNLIDPRTAMVNAVLNPIFATPNIDDVLVLRGDHMMGNRLSIANRDGHLLGVRPILTEAHTPYSVPSSVPGGSVRYRANGYTTDLYVSGEFQNGLPANNTITVDVTFYPVQQRSFLKVEMWDQYQGKWVQAAGTTVIDQGTEDVQIDVERAMKYINPSNFEYHLRLITLQTGTIGPNIQFPIYYDQVLVTVGLLQNPDP
jgi:hypothetical protein